jgi:DNA-binding transcriptional ArsR family regulator
MRVVVDDAPDRFEKYVSDTLHLPIRLAQWQGESLLPAFLRTQYSFYEAHVSAAHVLFLFSAEAPAPSTQTEHQRAMRDHWQGPVAFVFDRVTPYARRRMIQAGIAFVVPGSQLYLPELGMDLRERFRPPAREALRLRPSGQAALLWTLTMQTRHPNTPSKLAGELGYTPMAMGQALDQLEAAGLADVRRQGRERLFTMAGDPKDTWDKAQPLLASPIKRRHCLVKGSRGVADGLMSGLTALATYSSLAEPALPVFAMSAPQARQLLDSQDVIDVPSTDGADFELEVWSYDPRLLSKGPAVDRLSLYLALRDDQDERVQSALEEMLRGITW